MNAILSSRFARLAPVLLAVGLLSACGGNTVAVADNDASAPIVAHDASSLSDAAHSCVTHCATDLDCENSCPAVANARECCDTSTGVCYASATPACPQAPADAATIGD